MIAVLRQYELLELCRSSYYYSFQRYDSYNLMLMRLMGLEAIYSKPRMSKPCPDHKVYPYLLKGVRIDHADQVWSSDITYIRLLHGFVYLVVVMDWYSLYILSLELSITLEKVFFI